MPRKIKHNTYKFSLELQVGTTYSKTEFKRKLKDLMRYIESGISYADMEAANTFSDGYLRVDLEQLTLNDVEFIRETELP